jgi:hypothetical protein
MMKLIQEKLMKIVKGKVERYITKAMIRESEGKGTAV